MAGNARNGTHVIECDNNKGLFASGSCIREDVPFTGPAGEENILRGSHAGWLEQRLAP